MCLPTHAMKSNLKKRVREILKKKNQKLPNRIWQINRMYLCNRLSDSKLPYHDFASTRLILPYALQIVFLNVSQKDISNDWLFSWQIKLNFFIFFSFREPVHHSAIPDPPSHVYSSGPWVGEIPSSISNEPIDYIAFIDSIVDHSERDQALKDRARVRYFIFLKQI